MELCSITLKQWIQARNSKCTSNGKHTLLHFFVEVIINYNMYYYKVLSCDGETWKLDCQLLVLVCQIQPIQLIIQIIVSKKSMIFTSCGYNYFFIFTMV